MAFPKARAVPETGPSRRLAASGYREPADGDSCGKLVPAAFAGVQGLRESGIGPRGNLAGDIGWNCAFRSLDEVVLPITVSISGGPKWS